MWKKRRAVSLMDFLPQAPKCLSATPDLSLQDTTAKMINASSQNNNLFCPKDIVPSVSWPDELAQLHPSLLLFPSGYPRCQGFTCYDDLSKKSAKREDRATSVVLDS